MVAEIYDYCLLGADILANDDEGPGDLCLPETILKLRGIEISLICIGKPRKRVKKVEATKDFFIPRQSEAVVYGYIEGEDDDEEVANSEFVVEADKYFEEISGLSLGRTPVSGNQHAMRPIRMLNSTMEDVMIRQNTCIRLAEKSMGVMKQLVEHDSEASQDDFSSIRRIALSLRQIDITNSLH